MRLWNCENMGCGLSDDTPVPCAGCISCSASLQNKRAKYLILELLHAREILGVINSKSSRDRGDSHPWDPALLWQQGGSCRSQCSRGLSTCGSCGDWNPAATPGKKKQIPLSGLGRWLGNQLLFIYVSVESRCVCRFESSCWRSAVNQTDFVLQNLCCLVFNWWSCAWIQHCSSHRREDFV